MLPVTTITYAAARRFLTVGLFPTHLQPFGQPLHRRRAPVGRAQAAQRGVPHLRVLAVRLQPAIRRDPPPVARKGTVKAARQCARACAAPSPQHRSRASDLHLPVTRQGMVPVPCRIRCHRSVVPQRWVGPQPLSQRRRADPNVGVKVELIDGLAPLRDRATEEQLASVGLAGAVECGRSAGDDLVHVLEVWVVVEVPARVDSRARADLKNASDIQGMARGHRPALCRKASRRAPV